MEVAFLFQAASYCTPESGVEDFAGPSGEPVVKRRRYTTSEVTSLPKQCSKTRKKGVGGNIGQTKQQAFVTEWELAYHEVLAISKCYNNITKSVLAETDAKILNKELRSKNMKEYHDAVKQVFNFLNDMGNPYEVAGSVKLHHFITKKPYLKNNHKRYSAFLKMLPRIT